MTPPLTLPASRHWLERLQQAASFSSASLGWRHIEAHQFDGLRCWDFDLPPVGRHLIAAHLLKPCHIDTRWSGRSYRGRSSPGNTLLMGAGQDSVWHCSKSIDELHIFLDPKIVDEVVEEIDGRRYELINGLAIVDPTLHALSMQLSAEIQNPGLGNRLFADTMARSLALQLVRRHSTARFTEPPGDSMTPRQLRAATDYVESNLAADLSLDSLAAAPGMSAFRFARAFKKATGQSPRQYVIARRIERAKHLLRAHHHGIAEVGLLVGFATQSHFTAVFHRLCGATPKRYRDSVLS